ncbi:MAG: hypothetical protein GX556_13955 [Fibrobacter sp.]|nr:hypothetical protein [Fibrobacter sp.]
MFSLRINRPVGLRFLILLSYLFISEFPVCAGKYESPWFAGLNLSLNQRLCSYELSGGEIEQYRRKNLFTYGFSLGKRFGLLSNLRLKLPFLINYGRVLEDTVDQVILEDNSVEQLHLHTSLLHLGTVPELQFVFNVSSDAEMFLCAGGGFHYCRANEEETIAGDPNVRIIDSYLEDSRAFSVSADAGAGVELIIRDKRLSFQYGFRYWIPVFYETRRDLFPYKAIEYKEKYFTHTIQISLLINR